MKREPSGLDRIGFPDLPLKTGRFEETADWLIDLVRHREDLPSIVSHINISSYYYILKHPGLMQALKADSTLLLDGIGLKIAGFLLGFGSLPDLNGTDLFPMVMERAGAEGVSVYLLGAEGWIVERAARRFIERYPGLRIAGYRNGYFTEEDEPDIIAAINRSGADLLLVGRGFVTQEYFSLRCRHRLDVAAIWNVGGLFDFFSGAKPRAPLLLRKARLEWLFRFLLEPRRMWHRNMVAAPAAFARLCHARIRGWNNEQASPTAMRSPVRAETTETELVDVGDRQNLKGR